MDATNQEIVHALIKQVSLARPDGESERAVTTLITRPLWKRWLAFFGSPEDTEPTEWLGTSSERIYGSKTIVIESDRLESVSFAS